MPAWLNLEIMANMPLAGSLCLPRILAMFGILPFFSNQILTGLLKQGVAASLLLLVVPPVAASFVPGSLGLPEILLIAFKETVIGMLLGFPVAILFWAVEGTGFFIDNQRGSAMASSMDPLTGSQTTVMGSLFVQTFTVYFFISGSFLSLLTFLYTSYTIWPVTSFVPVLDGGDIPGHYLGLLDALMGAIVLLSAPVIVAMFLSELGLAFISRFAPQLNVFFLAMPVKSAIGIFVLIIYLPVMFDLAIEQGGQLNQIWETVRGLLQ